MDGLICDSFAGGGGASLGIEMALGRSPDIAINHDAQALAMHAANHPDTVHLSENIWQVDPLDYVGRKKVALAWFSPDCKHFSKAKGGKPVKRNIRDLAWVVVLWAKRVRPSVIVLENVEEFKTWGPLDGSDKPDPERRGETFKKWVGELRRLGYKVEWRELRACDYGAPTIRKRLFLIARCDGKPIVWPKQSHAKPDDLRVVAGKLKPWRTAAEIIDWWIPTPSVFWNKPWGKAIGVKRPLADNTMARIYKGVQRYVLDAGDPFIVTCNHGGKWQRGWSMDEPFKTVTASRDAHGVVVPTLVQTGYGERPGQSPRVPGLEKPLGTVVAGGIKHALVTPIISRQFGRSIGHGLDMPLGTVTSGGGGKSALVAPFIQHVQHASAVNGTMSVAEPLRTITANPKGGGMAVVSPFLAQHNTGVVGHDLRKPVSTITQRGTQQQLVTASLMSLKGATRRDSPLTAPHPTVLAGGLHSATVKAFLVKYYGNEKHGQSLCGPLHTVPTRERFGLITVKNQLWQIVDIGMRMLTARELFRAQGFPDEYIIDFDFNGRPMSKTAQVRMCGNSVSPMVAEAIIRANFAEYAVEQTRWAA